MHVLMSPVYYDEMENPKEGIVFFLYDRRIGHLSKP